MWENVSMTTLVALSARMFTFSAIFHYLLVIKVVFRAKKRHMKIFEDVCVPPTFCTFQFSSRILVLSCCSAVCECISQIQHTSSCHFLSVFCSVVDYVERSYCCHLIVMWEGQKKQVNTDWRKIKSFFFLPLVFSLAYSEYDDYRIAPIAACSCKHHIYNIILVSVPPGLPS